MNEFFIFGAGGGAKDIACIVSALDMWADLQAFVESDAIHSNRELLGKPVIALSEIRKGSAFVVAIGDSGARKKIVEQELQSMIFMNLIHPKAEVSEWVRIGTGSVISAGCIVTSNVEIGMHSHLNVLTSVAHDCILGDYFTSAPGVRISGTVRCGDRVMMGTNAAVRDNISIGSDVVVGVGAAVVKDITEKGVYGGVPAKKLET